jgi:hypothetical protein
MRIEGNSRTLFTGRRFEVRGSNKRHRPRAGGLKIRDSKTRYNIA